jgi:CBS domain containing-hemolysin-like protein
MSVDRRKLSAQADAGDKSAGRALAVTRRTSFMLSGAQLGITVTGLLVGFVAEPLVGESLGVLLGGVGFPPRSASPSERCSRLWPPRSCR